jgi:hypothetical protein
VLDHELLPFEPVVLDPIALLVAIRPDLLHLAAIRLRGGLHAVGNRVVCGTARFLLPDHGKRLHHHSGWNSPPRNHSHSTPHPIPHHAAYTTTYSPADTPTHTTTHAPFHTPAHPWRVRRPVQLCDRSGEHVGSRQEGVVLPCTSSRLPDTTANTATHFSANCPPYCPALRPTSHAHSTTQASRPVQLCRWICQLDGRLVSWQKSVVLQGARKRLPADRGWLRHNISTLRLRSGIRQLDGWVVRCEEGVVLSQRWQRLSSCDRRMCLRVSQGTRHEQVALSL